MPNYDYKVMRNIKIQETIDIIKDNVGEYYEIQVVEKDEKPKIVTTYNKIVIHVGNIASGPDLWHELTHAKMLTEQGRIFHPYPVDVYNVEQYYAFTNIITNIVYDIYVDVELSFRHSEIEKEYYNRKYNIYSAFLNKNKSIKKLSNELKNIINDLIKEYCQVLRDIIDGNIERLTKYQDNNISQQRQEVENWLDKTIFARQYEWISYNDLYVREHKVGVQND